ncbi:galactokinase [Xylocopa sonorina]|uniref:galactokinase n=1 Tax=Xylocopa sonorina TaxID=1818115 RepID=UPI00403A9EB1
MCKQIRLRLSYREMKQAIQLVTLVVGKPNYTSKWCHFKTLSGKIAGKKFKLRMNDANLHVFAEDPRLIRYLKGTLRSFKTKRAYVPGFQIVIASSLPMKRGLGSGSALVVALYTFLERITNIYTGNIVEKTLACHFAQKLAAGTSNARISDVLTSVIGSRGQIFALDVRSLGIDRCHWNAVDVELVLIELASDEKDRLSKCWNADEPRNGEISIVTKMMSRWRTHPIGASMMNLLFSSKCMETSKAVLEEDNRITQMTDAIRKERWDELGTMLTNNSRNMSF